MKANLKRLAKERNEMLKKRDVGELRKFITSHPEAYSAEFRQDIESANDKALEIALHKMIVNVPKLPKKLRKDSAFWLAIHGYDLNTY